VRRDGNPGERAVAIVGREFGYLVSSRRHEGGPGDQLWRGSSPTDLLIEVKAGRDPWENFRPADRDAMIEAGARYNVTPLLAFVIHVKRREVMWIPVEDWPA
jgi:hypothetical protein